MSYNSLQLATGKLLMIMIIRILRYISNFPVTGTCEFCLSLGNNHGKKLVVHVVPIIPCPNTQRLLLTSANSAKAYKSFTRTAP